LTTRPSNFNSSWAGYLTSILLKGTNLNIREASNSVCHAFRIYTGTDIYPVQVPYIFSDRSLSIQRSRFHPIQNQPTHKKVKSRTMRLGFIHPLLLAFGPGWVASTGLVQSRLRSVQVEKIAEVRSDKLEIATAIQ
jgi:hypothetical protein